MYARLVGPYELIGLDTPDDERSALLQETAGKGGMLMVALERELVEQAIAGAAEISVAGSNSPDGGETLVDTSIKRFLTASIDFLALLSR